MKGAGTAELPELSAIVQLLARPVCKPICNEEQKIFGVYTWQPSADCPPIMCWGRSVTRSQGVLGSGAGIGLFPQSTAVGHSCTPNTMLSFSGRRSIFRALLPIPKVNPHPASQQFALS